MIMGDRKKLEYVLMHLITNAIKHNREGGHVLLSVRTIELRSDGTGNF